MQRKSFDYSRTARSIKFYISIRRADGYLTVEQAAFYSADPFAFIDAVPERVLGFQPRTAEIDHAAQTIQAEPLVPKWAEDLINRNADLSGRLGRPYDRTQFRYRGAGWFDEYESGRRRARKQRRQYLERRALSLEDACRALSAALAAKLTEADEADYRSARGILTDAPQVTYPGVLLP